MSDSLLKKKTEKRIDPILFKADGNLLIDILGHFNLSDFLVYSTLNCRFPTFKLVVSDSGFTTSSNVGQSCALCVKHFLKV